MAKVPVPWLLGGRKSRLEMLTIQFEVAFIVMKNGLPPQSRLPE